MKNILMVAGTAILAGGERNLLEISYAALEEGYEVGLVAPGEGRLTREMRNLGCPTWSVAMPKLLNPLSLLRMRRIFGEVGCDIIHAHGHLASLYARTSAPGRKGAKVVYTLHGVHYPHYNNALKAKLFIRGEKLLRPSTDFFICVCEHDKLTAMDLGIIEEGRASVIYNGVAPPGDARPEATEALRKNFGLGDAIVLHIGRFMPEKDHHTLIESIPLVLENHPRAAFLLAGAGRLLEREKAHAARLGIPEDHLKFLGEIEDLDALYAASDIFVLPSLWEGFPYTVLDAMRAGVAVVATEVGGIPEAITSGKEGFLVEPENPVALADAVNHLLEHPQERAEMGYRGRRKVENFSLEKMCSDMLQVYELLLGQG